MKALEGLLKGFAEFRLGYYHEHLDLFEKLENPIRKSGRYAVNVRFH